MNTPKTILLLFCLQLILFCCNKNSPTPLNTIIADVDGVTQTFSFNDSANRANDINVYPGQTVYSANVFGNTTNAFKTNTIIISINLPQPITPGKYLFDNSNPQYDNIFISYAENPSNFDYIPDTRQPNPATITITSISSTNIQGTFSGDLFGTLDSARKITNGRFNVNFK